MKIKSFHNIKEQMVHIGNHWWSIARLITLVKDLPIMDIPIDHLNIYCKYENLTLRDMVMHMKAVEEADLNFPIILDEDGDIMDGRHRIMKVLLTGAKSIKAVRFNENPTPCRVDD